MNNYQRDTELKLSFHGAFNPTNILILTDWWLFNCKAPYTYCTYTQWFIVFLGSIEMSTCL